MTTESDADRLRGIAQEAIDSLANELVSTRAQLDVTQEHLSMTIRVLDTVVGRRQAGFMTEDALVEALRFAKKS